MKNFVTFSLLGLSLVAISSEAFAFRKFLDQFTEHYDANQISTQQLTDAQTCGLCHVRAGGGGKRTPYGEDFNRIGLDEGKGFPGIEFLDSDNDGYVNLEEIFLQTAPGKAEEIPAGRIELTLKDNGSLSIRPAMACAKMTIKAFGFVLENSTGELELSNIAGEKDIAVKGAAGAILAKCEQEQLAGSLLR